MDYALITAAVDFGSLVTGVGGVAVVLAGLYVAMRGARTFLGFIKR